MDKKILIMYITNASGHHKAALAIEQALKLVPEHPATITINGFGYIHPVIEKITHALYMGVIKKAPFIWDVLYDNPSIKKYLDFFNDGIKKRNSEKIRRLIEQENCSVAICTQAFPCGLVAGYKKIYHSSIKLIAVVTDFVPHSYWIHDEVDFYSVASEEAKQILLRHGVPDKKIKLFGIPISPLFNKPLNKNEVINRFQLASNKPIILVMGGGHGLGPIKQLLTTLDQSELDVQCVVITGINKKLFRSLQTQSFRKKVVLLEYVHTIAELMTIADVLVTKPGGITTAEAITKQLPMIILNPLPGQEQNNTNFLIANNCAEKADDAFDAVKKIELLLGQTEKRSVLQKSLLALAKPASSVQIAELALGLFQNSQQLH